MDIEAIVTRQPLKKLDCLVVGLFEDRKIEGDSDSILSRPERLFLRKKLQIRKFKGSWGEDVLLSGDTQGLSGLIWVVGLGKSSKFTHEHLRKTASRIYSRSKSEKWSSLQIDYHTLCVKGGDVTSAQSLAEGLILSSYRFDRYKSKKKDKNRPFPGLKSVALVFKQSRLKSALSSVPPTPVARRMRSAISCRFVVRRL
ncbi:MAG: hypothetical protein IH955_11115 [Chloroflexi bacterium]|nr:hypothetical protein [Chloroflexota bacterium]